MKGTKTVSIKSELRKEGIEVIEKIHPLNVNYIATTITKRLISNFPEHHFNYNELFAKIRGLNMYIAKMPNGIAAKYYYKNSSVYFSENTDFKNLSEVAIHECIHALQSIVNSRNKLLRLGLCDFKDVLLSGMGINEAAVQLMTMKCTNAKYDTVKYFDIEFISNSPDYYTLECSLVRQMAFITGEYILYNSTLYGNDNFKNKFITLTSEEAYEEITDNINLIIDLEDELNKILQKAKNTKTVTKQVSKLLKKSARLKEKIKHIFLKTQNKIFTSFFDNLFNYSSMQNFRQALYNYRKLIGTTEGYTYFNDYYINKMVALEAKYNNKALVPVKNTLLARTIRKIRILLDNIEATASNNIV